MDNQPTFNQRLNFLRDEMKVPNRDATRVYIDRIARSVAEHLSQPAALAMSDLPSPSPTIDPQLLVACHLTATLVWDLAEATVWRERFEYRSYLESKYTTTEAVEADLPAIESTFQFIDNLISRIQSRYPLGVPPVQRLANEDQAVSTAPSSSSAQT